MRQHDDVIKRSSLGCPRRLASPRSWSRSISLALIALLALSTLACAFLGANSGSASRPTIIRNRLPTLTPTPRTEAVPTAVGPPQATIAAAVPVVEAEMLQLPTAAAPAAAVTSPDSSPPHSQHVEAANSPAVDAPVPPAGDTDPTLLPTETPTPRATSVTVVPDIESGGWSFTSVRLYTGQNEEGILLYGDLINNTGGTQKLDFISGIFYDAQGQIIADAKNIDVYWPLDFILPGGQVPFEMTVNGIQSAANFNLSVEAEPSTETLRQDFEFSEVSQWNEGGKFCVTGQLRNRGNALQNYLVIATILYDSQNNIVNFSHQQESSFDQMIGDHPLDIEVCIGSSNQNVARYALRAWGQ